VLLFFVVVTNAVVVVVTTAVVVVTMVIKKLSQSIDPWTPKGFVKNISGIGSVAKKSSLYHEKYNLGLDILRDRGNYCTT
jgi:hypothetical protein